MSSENTDYEHKYRKYKERYLRLKEEDSETRKSRNNNLDSVQEGGVTSNIKELYTRLDEQFEKSGQLAKPGVDTTTDITIGVVAHVNPTRVYTGKRGSKQKPKDIPIKGVLSARQMVDGNNMYWVKGDSCVLFCSKEEHSRAEYSGDTYDWSISSDGGVYSGTTKRGKGTQVIFEFPASGGNLLEDALNTMDALGLSLWEYESEEESPMQEIVVESISNE